MTTLNLAEVKARHQRHPYGSCIITVLSEMQSDLNHCEPYCLADALEQAQAELERIAGHTRDAYDQRDAARAALEAMRDQSPELNLRPMCDPYGRTHDA